MIYHNPTSILGRRARRIILHYRSPGYNFDFFHPNNPILNVFLAKAISIQCFGCYTFYRSEELRIKRHGNMIVPLSMLTARLNERYMIFKPVMQARSNLHGLWVNILFHNRLALIID